MSVPSEARSIESAGDVPHQECQGDVAVSRNRSLNSDVQFHEDDPGWKFSELFPAVQVTEAEIDHAFLGARLVRVRNAEIARKFTFAAYDVGEMEETAPDPEIMGIECRGVLSTQAIAHKGWFPSVRADCNLAWEFEPERNALVRIDCMDGVTAIFTQPLQLEYLCPIKGQPRSCYPDIYVERWGSPLVLEIKDDLSRLKPDDAVRYVLLEKLFERAGVPYRGWDQDGIREEPAFKSADWLKRYKSVRLGAADHVELRRAFAGRPVMRLHELSRCLEDPDQSRSFAMIVRGWVVSERGVHVRDNPLVSLAYPPRRHA